MAISLHTLAGKTKLSSIIEFKMTETQRKTPQ